MATQFLRLTGYGRIAKIGAKGHETASGIIAEAYRAPGSTPHLKRPKAPNQIYGCGHLAVMKELENVVTLGRSKRGAGLRRDANVLYALVVSYPSTWRQIVSDNDRSTYALWQQATVDWLKGQFGDHLYSVLEHVDENRPHLHAFCLPHLDALNRIDHDWHPGYATRADALARGGDHKLGERAYRSGMRRFQDSFYECVSVRFGHARIGPRRKRLRRDAVLAKQNITHALRSVAELAAETHARLKAIPTLPELTAVDNLAQLQLALARTLKDLELGKPVDWHALGLAAARSGGETAAAPSHRQSNILDEERWAYSDDIGPSDIEFGYVADDDDPRSDRKSEDHEAELTWDDLDNDPSYQIDDHADVEDQDLDPEDV